MRQWCTTGRCEIAMIESGQGNYCFCLYILANQNIISRQPGKLLRYICAKCLNFSKCSKFGVFVKKIDGFFEIKLDFFSKSQKVANLL